MADININALAAAGTRTAADLVELYQPGEAAGTRNRKVSLEQLASYMGTGLGWFNVMDYGATLDGVYLDDGVATSGDQTFTSATAAFSAGDIGKVFEITKRGTGRHKTTIASINSGTSVELTVAPSFSASSCEVYYGTDDTAAWIAAITAVKDAGGGEVVSPSGISIADGALQDTGNANAQIPLPTMDAGSERPVSITIRGAVAPYNVGSVTRTVKPTVGGTIIKSTLNSGTGAVIRGARSSNTAFTNIHVHVENLVVRTPDNPTLSGIDLSKVAAGSVKNVNVDVGCYSDTGPTQPTTSTSFGIKMPENNNGVENTIDNAFVLGFYNNYRLGEHTSAGFMQSWFSRNGVVVPSAYHASRIKHLVSVHNTNHLTSDGSGAAYLDIDLFDLEHAPTSATDWLETVYVVNDASNYLRGSCKYHAVLGGTGVVDTFQVNGAANFSCKRAGRNSSSNSSVNALSIASGVVDIDCSRGDFFTLSLTANVTSITLSGLPLSGRAQSIAVRMKQDATGGRTVSLPSSFKATGGSDTAVASAANAYTLLTATTFDQGTRWEYAMQEIAA